MTNKERIEKLQKLPQDAEVVVKNEGTKTVLWISTAAVEKDEETIVIE